MKLSCLKNNLLYAVSLVARIVGTKVSLPILSNILLLTDKGRLKISATDLELGISTWIGGKIEKNGSITLPTKLFSEFISTIPDEKIIIEVAEKKAIIKSKNTQSIIRGLDAVDFPCIPEIKTPLIIITIKAQKLKTALEKTVFACAIDETKPALAGVLFKIKKEEMILAATDSFRLSEHKIKGIKSANVKEFIIPKRTASELARIIGENEEEIKLKVSDNQISFELENTYFISRLVEGNFPDYTQIIPKSYKTTVTVDKTKLFQALKTASLFSREAANTINIKIDDKKIDIYATSQQLGENRSEIVDIKKEGKKIKFSINASFLLECLNMVGEEKIELKIVDETSPILIKPQKNTTFFFLVMPLKQE